MKIYYHILFTALLFFTVAVTCAAHNFSDTIPSKPPSLNLAAITTEDLAEDSVTISIPFSRAGNLIIVRAKADTTEGNFILDTGAPGLVLNITYFRDHPVTSSSNEEQGGIAGAVSASKTEIKQFALDKLLSSSINADLVNMGNIENLRGIKIYGLIGLSLFRRCELIIDYENNVLHIHRYGKKNTDFYQHPSLNNMEAYSTVPFEVRYEKIIITTLLAEKKIRFMIDSGAESNVLDSRLPDKVFENVEILKRVQLNGVGQKKVEALYGNLINLTVGDQNAGVMPFIITNLEKACMGDNTCIDGILGFDFLGLHKIGFNFVKNKMYIWK